MLRHVKHITLWLLFALMCTSCTGVHDIREARSIVAAADSLRATGQVPYTLNRSNSSNLSNDSLPPDSTALAFAVTTLEPVRLLFPTDYAHANYYYGRLLRDAGNQPEAMLAFLRAVHSRTKDHAIKGRAYSNSGTICHLAENYSLSYEMYAKSAEEFLLNDNKRAYYYALNDMALELGEDSMKNQSIQLTNQIERECTDSDVLTKIWETRADAYLTAKMYDSTIYCIKQLHERGNTEPTGFLLLARAYEGLNIIDSALFYAKKVYDESSFYGDKFNALFILSHYDSTLTPEEILSISSEREDIRFYQHEPAKKKLTQAVLLLQQDLKRKPDLTWLWAILMTLLVVTIPLSTYIQKQKSKRQLYSQQVEDLQHKQDVLSEQNLQLEQQYTLRQEKAMKEMEEFCHSITTDNIHKTLSWKNFDQMCNIVNQRMFGLVDKLKSRGITSEPELRLCVLVAVGRFNNKEMASLVPYGYDSLKTTKSTIANRLGVSGRKMREFLLHLAL